MNNSRSKNVFWGTFSGVLLSLCTLISGFIVPKLIISTYGSEINGLASSITQFISYFSLLEAGLAGASIYALYKPLAERDQSKINSILSESKSSYLKIGTIYLLLVLCMSFIYPLLTSSVLSYFNTALLVLSIGFSGALEFYTMSRYRVLLSATQKTYVISIAGIIGAIVKIILVIIFTALKLNVVFVYFISTLSIFIRTLILRAYTKIKYPDVDYNAKFERGNIKQRKDVTLMQVLGSVQQAYPVVLMTICAIPFKDISVYNVYMIIIAGLQTIMNVFLNGSIYSSFGELITKNEKDKLKKAFGEFETLCFVVMTTLYSCLSILYLPFIDIYTAGITDADYHRPIYAILLTANIILYTIKNPLCAMIQAAGHYKKTRWRTITQAAIGVIVPTVLAPFLGIPGIIIGMIASNLYRTVDALFYVPRKILDSSIFNSLKKMILMLVIIAGLTVINALTVKIQVTNYFEWFLYAFIVGIVSVSISLGAFGVSCKNEMKSFYLRVKGLFKKNHECK